MSCTEGLADAFATTTYIGNSNDALGQKCECAMKTEQVSRFCTISSEALKESSVTNWFNTVEGKFESTTSFVLAFIMAVLVMYSYWFGIIYIIFYIFQILLIN